MTYKDEIAEAIERVYLDDDNSFVPEARAALTKLEEIMTSEEFLNDLAGGDGGLRQCIKSDFEEAFNKIKGE